MCLVIKKCYLMAEDLGLHMKDYDQVAGNLAAQNVIPLQAISLLSQVL